MTENQRLSQWAEGQGFNAPALARKLELDRSYVHQLMVGDRSLSPAFKWRFSVVFGWDEACDIFDTEVVTNGNGHK